MKSNISYALLIVAIVIMCVTLVPPVSAAGEPTVQVSEYHVSPSVMMPDSLGTITVVLKNTATTAQQKENSGVVASEFITSTTTDINVNIENVRLEGKGLTVLSQDFDHVGAIGPGQSIPITFTVKAPVVNGLYYPEVWIDTTGGKSTRFPIPVNVNTPIGIQKQAVLIVESSLSDTVNPGDEIPVLVTIKNGGLTGADDVTVKVDNISTMIAPKTTDFYHVGAVGPGKEQNISLILLSDKNLNPGLIRVPLTIQYNWVDGSSYVVQSLIDISVKGKAELGFVSVDTNPPRLTENTPFDLTIRIENTGTGEAKQVSAKVDLPAEGTKEAFIGKIKPGNDAPAIFLLEGTKSGNHPYNLTITYTDDMGVHTMTRQMNLRVPASDWTGTVVMVLIVLGILGFLGYRYWYLPKTKGDGTFPWDKKN
ncbi:MAG TPA: S-layer protein [Methanoregulaceae archaeon]|nr:S-layer protein [Methanoregulaceae archaeon]